MLDSFTCPYCQNSYALHYQTYGTAIVNSSGNICKEDSYYAVKLEYFTCPKCQNTVVYAEGTGAYVKFNRKQLLPGSSAKIFPNYVPDAIKQDYEEAYAILELSPKASATLSRRCIQGMIHDKWNIVLKNLNQEITALRDKIDPTLWSAIDALRQLGNIGAHMEKDIDTIVDIDPDESEKLIRLVEILIKEWYVIPHEREELLSGIVQINENKQEQRKKTE